MHQGGDRPGRLQDVGDSAGEVRCRVERHHARTWFQRCANAVAQQDHLTPFVPQGGGQCRRHTAAVVGHDDGVAWSEIDRRTLPGPGDRAKHQTPGRRRARGESRDERTDRPARRLGPWGDLNDWPGLRDGHCLDGLRGDITHRELRCARPFERSQRVVLKQRVKQRVK